MMLSNLLILPMLLPFLCALILVFLKNNDRISKYLYLGTMTITTIISLMLLIYVQRHRPITLDFGGWSAPFGIQFLGDSLSLIMVTTASFVITLIMAYGFGRGEHKANRYHLPSFILFLSVGVIGSFLTSDLFNLYVMFEIMLLASFVLITLGQSVEQLRAAIIYVVLNIIGSWLFLLGIGLLYKTVGTLNFSHIAMRLNDMGDNRTVTMISLIFLVAFSAKAALVLFMWLPKAYAVLNTELAALFAALMIITSLIAMYSLFRILFYMYFGDKDGEEVNFKKIPLYRKRILSILVVVVIAIGIAAPVVLNVTSDATELNTSDQLYQKLVNPHLKGED